MPTLSSSTRRQVLLVGGVCSLAFLALAGLFVDFVLDDAYISYRFAQHLAEGRGPTWNPSEAPVEGYTNPLWVALLAMALALGAEPVVISKLLSIAAALALIWLLAFASRRLHWSHALVLTGALGFSAPFAFLAMMGLETALAALLLALTAGAAAEVVTRPRATAILLFHAAAFFSMLARFDSGLFVAGALAGLLVVLGAMDRDPRAVRRLLLGGLPFLVLGLLYMLWRFDYYGYWLPNVFYVKVLDPAALPGPSGPKYVGTFVARVLAPYLLLALLSWRRGASKRAWRSILPILLGCLLTGAFFFVVVPFQSLLWRFLYPVTPRPRRSGGRGGPRVPR